MSGAYNQEGICVNFSQAEGNIKASQMSATIFLKKKNMKP